MIDDWGTQLHDALTETSPQHYLAVMTVCASARYSQRAMNGLQHTAAFVVQFRAGSNFPMALTARMRQRSKQEFMESRHASHHPARRHSAYTYRGRGSEVDPLGRSRPRVMWRFSRR
jgi:hypothetical protein